MKKLILLMAFAGIFINAHAIRVEFGQHVVINAPVYEDLYVAGGTVTINAVIHGDLIIAGGTVIINDTVTNDILVVGGTITFNGFVGDDIRCAGGRISITKNVTGDLVAAGGEIVLAKGVSAGNFLGTGGDVTINGIIAGELRGTFGDIIINGSAEHDINCRAGSITINGTVGGISRLAARFIITGDHAVFNNSIYYWSEQDAPDFKKHITAGKVIYDPSLRIQYSKWYYLGATTIFMLLWYLGMAFLMIVIILYLFRSTMQKAATIVYNHSLKSTGYGLLFYIAVPVAAAVSFITVIGVPVGLLLLAAYIALLLLTSVLISIVTAYWINNRYHKEWTLLRLIFVSFGLFILLKLISLTPFAGWIILIVLACMMSGAILQAIKWKRKKVLPVVD